MNTNEVTVEQLTTEYVAAVKGGRVREERDGSLWLDGHRVRSEKHCRAIVRALEKLGQ